MSKEILQDLKDALDQGKSIQPNSILALAIDAALNDKSNAEEIFQRNAETLMIQYDHREFKNTHRTLYQVIIKSIEEYENNLQN